MTDMRGTLVPDHVHGTMNGYGNYGCRCGMCTAANSDHVAMQRHARFNAPTPDHVHGSDNGYTNYGCRCGGCREAHRAVNERYRARRK